MKLPLTIQPLEDGSMPYEEGRYQVIDSSDDYYRVIMHNDPYYNQVPTEEIAKILIRSANLLPKAVELLKLVFEGEYVHGSTYDKLSEFLTKLEEDENNK